MSLNFDALQPKNMPENNMFIPKEHIVPFYDHYPHPGRPEIPNPLVRPVPIPPNMVPQLIPGYHDDSVTWCLQELGQVHTGI